MRKSHEHGGEKRNIVPGMSSRMKADRVDVQNRPTKLADRPGLRVFQYVASIAEKHTTTSRYEHSVTVGILQQQLATVVDYRSTLFDIDEYTVTAVKRFVDARIFSHSHILLFIEYVTPSYTFLESIKSLVCRLITMQHE